MKNLILVTLLVVTFFVEHSYGQKKLCLTFEINQRAELLNPDALKAKGELDLFTKEYLKKSSKSEEVYIIPVVFHVMHNYGSENISRDQILDAIRVLNNDFRKLNADTINIIPEFQGIAVDSRIEFRLATIDPNGNCTDGIVRVATSSTYYGDESTKMESPAWPRNKYLNIWTVESIASGAAGYSYYPSSVANSWGEDVDGVMVLYDYVGSIWPSSTMTSRTLTHEIGHYLNLPHPWGSSNQPGLLTNCDIDDGVSDTPNTIGHTSCNLYSVTCGSLDNVQNYMDYSYCGVMFTDGQKQRMRAALNSTVSGRNNLWTLSNLIATGTDDGAIAQTCLPIADFTSSLHYGCTGLTVQFTDLSWNTDTITSRSWTFPGGVPSSSTDQNPTVIYNSAGAYNATLTVTNPAGTDQFTQLNTVNVIDPAFGESIPWVEGFENNVFPQHPTDITKNWEVYGDANLNWHRLSGVSSSGNACSIFENNNNVESQSSTMLSPNILLAGFNPVNKIKFKVAYAQRNENTIDKLWAFISYDCGVSWSLRYNKSGASLATNGGNYVSAFIPGTTDWRQEQINLGSLLNKPYLRIKFVATSSEGNPIYIDDINFEQVTGFEELSLSEKYNFSVFPNPVNNETKIMFDLGKKENVLFELYDIVGKQIGIYSKEYPMGNVELDFNQIFSSQFQQGIYLLKTSINGSAETIKLIIE